MPAIDPLTLLDQLEAAEDRDIAIAQFQSAIADFGVTEGFIASNIPIELYDPWLSGKIPHDFYGHAVHSLHDDLSAALRPLTLGVDSMPVAHAKQSVRPFMIRAEWSFEDPLRLKNVRTEIALSVLAYNLTRVINILGITPLIQAIRA